jgi:hypothetical protein
MNKYGAVLDDFGFRAFFAALQTQYISHFATLLYPDWVAERQWLDHHHAFGIKYQIGQDEALDYHMDER